MNIDWHAWINSGAIPIVIYIVRQMWVMRTNHLNHMQKQLDRMEKMLLEHLKWHAEK